METVLDSPFVPLMVIVDAVLEQQKKASEESARQSSGGANDLNQDFSDSVLSNPNQYR